MDTSRVRTDSNHCFCQGINHTRGGIAVQELCILAYYRYASNRPADADTRPQLDVDRKYKYETARLAYPEAAYQHCKVSNISLKNMSSARHGSFSILRLYDTQSTPKPCSNN